ncbi:uncharacterized protein TNCT_441081 [Trichonephila clavata]|uniref:Uncharacterized protein n=1 Tax=Trichonephila clavata TaxID=2740835 RepID=A0A8X6IS05_TRICU|nr:uncharacterized protein TNCT_441081 [Trichonephila clavata]
MSATVGFHYFTLIVHGTSCTAVQILHANIIKRSAVFTFGLITLKMRTSHIILVCVVFCSLLLVSTEVAGHPHKERKSINKRDDYSMQNLGKEAINSIIDTAVDAVASMMEGVVDSLMGR